MRREISPAVIVGILVAIVAVVFYVFWRSSVPEGVRTAKPPRVPPPGAGAGIPAEPMAEPGGAPAPPRPGTAAPAPPE